MAAPSIVSSGTQAATLTVEHTLVTTAVPGFYELHVDINALAGGETVVLRLKESVLESGTVREVGYASIAGAAAAPFIRSLGPFSFPRGVTATLTQTGGTGRSYPWRLDRVG